jgi:hypothetical protein
MNKQTAVHVDCIWALIYGTVLTFAIVHHNALGAIGFSMLFIGKVLDGIASYLNYKKGK